MRRIALLLLAAAGVAAASQPSRHWSDATARVVLDNGLTVLMLQRGDLPIVSVQALYRVGSRNERPGETGAAHFVEHMAFRSTEEIAKQDLTDQILRWGGRWNGYTSYDQTVYGSHTPSQYLEWLIYLERQRMRHVRFDDAEVERERTSVIAEEQQYRNYPSYVLVEHRLRRAALVAHPYGSPIMGRLSDLQGVTTEELERFYRDRYAPNNLILAIVGRFDPQEALAFVRRHFGGVPGYGVTTAIRTVEPEQHGPRRVVMRASGGEAHVELAVHAPAASHPDFATLLVLDGVLAGGKTPGRDRVRPDSRLHRALIDPGLATNVTTEVELSEYAGLYSIGIDTARDADLSAVEARLDAVLDETMTALEDAEARRAARQVRAALAFDADSNRAIADLLTVYEQMGSVALLSSIPQRVLAVDAGSVRAFARRRLGADRRSIGLLLPASSSSADEATGASGSSAAAQAVATPPPTGRTTRPIPEPSLAVPALPVPVVRRLENGLTIVAAGVPGQSTHLRVRVEAGSRFDPPGRDGVALIAARLLARGTTSPHQALQDREVRVSMSAFDEDDPFTMRNVVEVAVAALPDDLARAAEGLVPALAGPALTAGNLDFVKSSIEAEIESNQGNSRWRADRAVFDHLFDASSAYGRSPYGTAQSRAAITLADVVAFREAFYRPERTVVAIAGPLDPTVAIERVASVLGGWRAEGPATPASDDHPGSESPPADARPSTTPPPWQARVIHIAMEKEQASIAVGLPGTARTSEDYAALAALNYLLGETGYAGRLGERLVDTGLAYSVYSSLLADRLAGPILITTDATRPREAVGRIVATLDEFASRGVTDAELREAKGFVLGRLLFRFESAPAATAALADLVYFGENASPRIFARSVLGLSPAAINAAARRYYDTSRAAIVVAGRW
jgi:zinc protease